MQSELDRRLALDRMTGFRRRGADAGLGWRSTVGIVPDARLPRVALAYDWPWSHAARASAAIRSPALLAE